jgi:hypothetical protein
MVGLPDTIIPALPDGGRLRAAFGVFGSGFCQSFNRIGCRTMRHRSGLHTIAAPSLWCSSGAALRSRLKDDVLAPGLI